MAIIKVQFEANESDVKRYTDLLVKAGVAADSLGKEVKEAGNQSNESFGKISGGIDTMITGVKAFLALGLVREVFNIAKAASQMAASAEGISSAFKNLGGTKQDIQSLSDAVGGTVSNINLMKFAVMALQKGFNMDQVVKVFTLLDKQADSTGKSFEEMAIKFLKGAKDIPALMVDVAKKTEELGNVVGEMSDAYDRAGVAQENLQLAFGEFINSPAIQDSLNFFAKSLNWLTTIGQSEVTLFKGTGEELAIEINRIGVEINKLQDEVKTERDKPKILQEAFGLTETAKEKNLRELNTQWSALTGQLRVKQDERDKVVVPQETESGGKAGNAYAMGFIEGVVSTFDTEIKGGEIGFLLDEAQDRARRKEGATFDPAFEEDIKEITDDFSTKGVKASDDIKFNMEAAALSAFAMVDSLASLGDTNADKGKKFFAVLQGLLSIASLIPGPQQLGFGIASAGVGTVGRLVTRNKGGYIPGYGPDADSVLMAATPGEFVVRRSSTQMSPLLLDAINAGELDDKIFKKLQAAPPLIVLNQDQVVAAIERMPQVDLYKSGSALYEARKSADGRRTSRKQRLMI